MTQLQFSSSAHALVRKNEEFSGGLHYTVVVGVDALEEDELLLEHLSTLSPIELGGDDRSAFSLPAPYTTLAVGHIEFLVSSPIYGFGNDHVANAIGSAWSEFDAHSFTAESAASDAQFNLTPRFIEEMMEICDEEWVGRFAAVVEARTHPAFNDADIYMAALRELMPLTRANTALLASFAIEHAAQSSHEIIALTERIRGFSRDLPDQAIRMRPAPGQSSADHFRVYASLADMTEDAVGPPRDLTIRTA